MASPFTVGSESPKDSFPQHIDYSVYAVVQALCARRGCVSYEVTTMSSMAIHIIANFGLDSFNCRSGSPDKNLCSRITPLPKGVHA
jgi:hypothetical protein